MKDEQCRKLNQYKSDATVMVTIRCMTYNHEPYIRQCLEGFVMQQTNFHFEAIVHDDASTDGTAAIIREYAEKYPDIIKPIYETENQYSKHDGSLDRIMDAHMRGKYIALCEGDDYWTDPLKLQKQVDLLEQYPECSMCCGGYIAKQKGISDKKRICRKGKMNYFQFSLNDWSKFWYTKTLTVLYKNEASFEFKRNISRYFYGRDVHLFYNLLKWGNGIYLSDYLGVYNLHVGGIFSLKSSEQKVIDNYNCYKELFELHHDDCLRQAYLYTILQQMLYDRNKMNMFKEGWKNAYLLRDKCKLLFLLLPSSIVHFVLNLRNMYRQ